MGCIGHDKFGKILQTHMTKEGVHAAYVYSLDMQTGLCAVCLADMGRYVRPSQSNICKIANIFVKLFHVFAKYYFDILF